MRPKGAGVSAALANPAGRMQITLAKITITLFGLKMYGFFMRSPLDYDADYAAR
jgi:hypothetical protein